MPGRTLLAFILTFSAAAAQDGVTITQEPNKTVINQSADKAVINWTSFNVPAGYTVQFVQPSAASWTLNRVTGSQASRIDGTLLANGNIFILNPYGVFFSSTAQVNVNSLLVSTLSVSDSDFYSGTIRLAQDPGVPLSYVVNHGTITAAPGGFVIFAAPLVENSGRIETPAGTIQLLAGREVTISLGTSGLVNVTLGAVNEQGTVFVAEETASDIAKAAVNTKGLVESGAIVEENGVVKFVAAEGLAVNKGTLSAPGGSVTVNSTQATVTSNTSRIEVDGIGMNSAGGCAYVLSYQNTSFEGRILARGDTGGFIEVSAPRNLYFYGLADASGLVTPGTLYIDPLTLLIINGAGPGTLDGSAADGTIVAADPDVAPNSLSEVRLETIAAGTNVILEATNTITVENLADNTLAFAQTGSVTWRTIANGDNNGVRFLDANDTVTTAGASFTIEATGALLPTFGIDIGNVNTNGGNITLTVNANVRAGNLTANNAVISINGDRNANTVGGIVQRNGTVWTARDLILLSADGIVDEGGGFVDTVVSRLQARNVVTPGTLTDITGSIRISNTGDLQLIDLLGGGLSAVLNDSGVSGDVIEITTAGNLTLSGTVGSNAPAAILRPITLTTTAGGSILDDGNQATTIFSNTSITLVSANNIGGVGPNDSTFFNPFIDVSWLTASPTTVTATAPGTILISRTAQNDLATTFGGTNTSVLTYNSTGASTIGFANLVGRVRIDSGIFNGVDDDVIVGSRESANNDVNLLGNVVFTAGNNVVTTGASIRIHADRSIIQEAGPLTLQTTAAGRVELNSDSPLTSPTNPGGFGLINLSQGLTITTRDLVARSSEGVTITGVLNITNLQVTNGQGGPVQAGTAVVVTSTGAGAITVADVDGSGYGVRNLGTGPLTLSNPGNLVFNADVFANGVVTITSTTGSLIDDGLQTTEIRGAGVVNLNAPAGSIGAAGVVNYLDVVWGTLNATALLDIFISGVGGTVNTSTIAVFDSTTGGGRTLGLANVGGSLNIDSAIFQNQNDTLLFDTTVGNLLLNATVSTNNGSNITLTANGGGGIVDDGNQLTTIVTTGTISLNADLGNIGGPGLANHIDATFGFAALNATAGGNIFVSVVGGGNLVTSAIPVVLNSTGANRTVSLANAGGDLTLDSAIFAAIDDNVGLSAAGNLVLGSAINTTGTGTSLFEATGTIALNAAMTTNGGATFTSGGDLTLNAGLAGNGLFTFAIGGNFLQNAGGNVAAGAGGSVNLNVTGTYTQDPTGSFTAGGNITIRSGGDMLLGLVDSGAAADIRSTNGSITDNNDVAPGTLNVRALGDSVMQAGGTIGVPNCIEIDITGTMTVQASGQLPMAPFASPVSVNMCGVVTPSMRLTFYRNPFPVPGFLGNTPGLVIFNGVIQEPIAFPLPRFPSAGNLYLDLETRRIVIQDRVDDGDVYLAQVLREDENYAGPYNTPSKRPADAIVKNSKGKTVLEALRGKTYLGGALSVEDVIVRKDGNSTTIDVLLRNNTFRRINASYLIEFRGPQNQLFHGAKREWTPFSVQSQANIVVSNSVGVDGVSDFELYIVTTTQGQGTPDPRGSR